MSGVYGQVFTGERKGLTFLICLSLKWTSREIQHLGSAQKEH